MRVGLLCITLSVSIIVTQWINTKRCLAYNCWLIPNNSFTFLPTTPHHRNTKCLLITLRVSSFPMVPTGSLHQVHYRRGCVKLHLPQQLDSTIINGAGYIQCNSEANIKKKDQSYKHDLMHHFRNVFGVDLDSPAVLVSAHRAAEPDRALWSFPGLSCLLCRWLIRKGMGWSGVSVISLVIISCTRDKMGGRREGRLSRSDWRRGEIQHLCLKWGKWPVS